MQYVGDIEDTREKLQPPADGIDDERSAAPPLEGSSPASGDAPKPSRQFKTFFICVLILAFVQAFSATQFGHRLGAVLGVGFFLHAVAVLWVEIGLLTPRYFKIIWAAGFGLVLCLLSIRGLNQYRAPPLSFFPERCEVAGCTRVSVEHPQRGYNIGPLGFRLSRNDLRNILTVFISSETQTSEIFRDIQFSKLPTGELVDISHSRALSVVFGFVDDLFVRITCDPYTGNALVESQSSPRIGSFDFEVNENRVQRLWHHFERSAVLYPVAPCAKRPKV